MMACSSLTKQSWYPIRKFLPGAPDSDRILGILDAKSRRAIEGKEERSRLTCWSPAIRRNALTRGNAVGGRRAGNPAHPADRRNPGIGTVLQASNAGTPAIHMNGSDSRRLTAILSHASGATLPMRFVDATRKPNFFASVTKRLFWRLSMSFPELYLLGAAHLLPPSPKNAPPSSLQYRARRT